MKGETEVNWNFQLFSAAFQPGSITGRTVAYVRYTIWGHVVKTAFAPTYSVPLYFVTRVRSQKAEGGKVICKARTEVGFIPGLRSSLILFKTWNKRILQRKEFYLKGLEGTQNLFPRWISVLVNVWNWDFLGKWVSERGKRVFVCRVPFQIHVTFFWSHPQRMNLSRCDKHSGGTTQRNASTIEPVGISRSSSVAAKKSAKPFQRPRLFNAEAFIHARLAFMFFPLKRPQSPKHLQRKFLRVDRPPGNGANTTVACKRNATAVPLPKIHILVRQICKN